MELTGKINILITLSEKDIKELIDNVLYEHGYKLKDITVKVHGKAGKSQLQEVTCDCEMISGAVNNISKNIKKEKKDGKWTDFKKKDGVLAVETDDDK